MDTTALRGAYDRFFEAASTPTSVTRRTEGGMPTRCWPMS